MRRVFAAERLVSTPRLAGELKTAMLNEDQAAHSRCLPFFQGPRHWCEAITFATLRLQIAHFSIRFCRSRHAQLPEARRHRQGAALNRQSAPHQLLAAARMHLRRPTPVFVNRVCFLLAFRLQARKLRSRSSGLRSRLESSVRRRALHRKFANSAIEILCCALELAGIAGNPAENGVTSQSRLGS